MFTGLIVRASLVFGAAALCGFVWLMLFKTIDGYGYERGVAEMSVKSMIEAEALRERLENAASEREAEIEARIAQSETRASEAENRANEALAELVNNDQSFAQCEGQTLPDSVRRHFPIGVLFEAPTADSADS